MLHLAIDQHAKQITVCVSNAEGDEVWLQHSIQGLWLGATLAGFPPTCQHTISNSLVQRLVIPHL